MKNKSFWPPKNQVIYAIKTSKNVYTSIYRFGGPHVKIIQMFSMNRTWIVHNIVWGSLTWHVDPSAMRGGFDEQAVCATPNEYAELGLSLHASGVCASTSYWDSQFASDLWTCVPLCTRTKEHAYMLLHAHASFKYACMVFCTSQTAKLMCKLHVQLDLKWNFNFSRIWLVAGARDGTDGYNAATVQDAINKMADGVPWQLVNRPAWYIYIF